MSDYHDERRTEALQAEVVALRAALEQERETSAKLLAAAETADWEQVRLNGGPPCFHIEEDGWFCFRAKRWAGHPTHHKFVTLHAALLSGREESDTDG